MATLSKAGAKMSSSLGFSVGSGSGCVGGDVWGGYGVFRSARKGWDRRRSGRSGVASALARDRASAHVDNVHEFKFWPLQRHPRFRDGVVRIQDLSCTALGEKRMARFAGYVSIARSPLNSVWPSAFNHKSEESPRIVSSSQQNGPGDESEPPPLFMGNQLKRFSHFRDGIVHWCRYLEVKKDVRSHGQGVLLRDEEYPAPKMPFGEGSAADDIDNNSSDLTVICFDIETTGFSPTNDRIIEFAGRDLAGGIYSTIETLVNPERDVKNEKVHHISTRMVNHARVPKWKDVALPLVDFVGSRRKGQGLVILVAHNGKRFDVPFIMNEFHSCGVSIPPYWRFADSLPLAKVVMKASGISPMPKTSLGELVTYYSLPSLGNAHRAMADVNMLAQVLPRLMNDLEMGTSELLEQSFSADEVVLKGKDLKKEMVNSSELVDKKALHTRRLVTNVNGSVPWDLMLLDPARRSGDEFDRTLLVNFGKSWRPSSEKFPSQGNGPTFEMPDLGGRKSGPSKKIIRQHVGRAGAAPLMQNPPRVFRTPAVRPKEVDVQRDMKT